MRDQFLYEHSGTFEEALVSELANEGYTLRVTGVITLPSCVG